MKWLQAYSTVAKLFVIVPTVFPTPMISWLPHHTKIQQTNYCISILIINLLIISCSIFDPRCIVATSIQYCWCTPPVELS